MRAAFSKLTLENTPWLAVLLLLALGCVFSQSEKTTFVAYTCYQCQLLEKSAHFLFLPPLVCPPSGLSYSLEAGGHDLENPG